MRVVIKGVCDWKYSPGNKHSPQTSSLSTTIFQGCASFRECRSGFDLNHSWLLWQPIGIEVSTCSERTSVDMIFFGRFLLKCRNLDECGETNRLTNQPCWLSGSFCIYFSPFSAGVSLGRSLLDFVQLPIYLQQQTKETVAVWFSVSYLPKTLCWGTRRFFAPQGNVQWPWCYQHCHAPGICTYDGSSSTFRTPDPLQLTTPATMLPCVSVCYMCLPGWL